MTSTLSARRPSPAAPVMDVTGGWHRYRWAALGVLAAVAVLWPIVFALTDSDGEADLVGLVAPWANASAAVGWTAVVLLMLVALVHHAAAAVAARAAAGRPLPWGEVLAAQFAASAVNRLTPAGLGGDTLNARFFTRRGGVRPAEATAAVSALVVLGGLADGVALCLVVLAAAALGVPGASTYLPALQRVLTSWTPGATWWWVAGGALLALGATAVVLRRRDPRIAHRIADGARRYAGAIRGLACNPRRFATLSVASAGTTLVLGAGFAATAVLTAHGAPLRDFGALLIGYMVASAVGNAVPVPGGVGTTEAAYVAVLVAAGLPLVTATAVTLLFRLITFWLPAAVGVPALRRLRARGAL